MALSQADLGNDLVLFHDGGVTATALNDIMGGPCTLLYIRASNNHATLLASLKFYDALSPTIGTTDPVESYVLGGTGAIGGGFYGIPVAPPDGLAFEIGLSFAATQYVSGGDEGGAGGSTNPDGTIVVSLLCKKGT